jgi:hypothetical protein
MKNARLVAGSRRVEVLRHRRIVVVMAPPVEKLDPVGRVQGFTTASRLQDEPVYAIELVTNQNTLKVDGESGVLSFYAQVPYQAIKGKIDSLLLACDVATPNMRYPAAFGRIRGMATNVRHQDRT